MIFGQSEDTFRTVSLSDQRSDLNSRKLACLGWALTSAFYLHTRGATLECHPFDGPRKCSSVLAVPDGF